MTVKRLIEQDPKALDTTNEVRALKGSMQGGATGVPGPVGRIAQIADSIGRELGENLILKNTSRRIRRDIDIARWQKQTIQYEVGIDQMQREWDVLAKRCPQGGKTLVSRKRRLRDAKDRSETPLEKRGKRTRRSHPRWRTWS